MGRGLQRHPARGGSRDTTRLVCHAGRAELGGRTRRGQRGHDDGDLGSRRSAAAVLGLARALGEPTDGRATTRRTDTTDQPLRPALRGGARSRGHRHRDAPAGDEPGRPDRVVVRRRHARRRQVHGRARRGSDGARGSHRSGGRCRRVRGPRGGGPPRARTGVSRRRAARRHETHPVCRRAGAGRRRPRAGTAPRRLVRASARPDRPSPRRVPRSAHGPVRRLGHRAQRVTDVGRAQS